MRNTLVRSWRHLILLPALVAVSSVPAQSPGTVGPNSASQECHGLESDAAQIGDANRCAKARRWAIHPYWTQISDWYGAERGSTMRIMCAAPRVIEANGQRRLFWVTRSIYVSPNEFADRSDEQVYSYLPAPSRVNIQAFNHRAVELFSDDTAAGNAACSPLYFPERPKPAN